MAGDKHQVPRWEWQNRTLYFVDAQGAKTVPGVDDIYQILVEGHPVRDDTTAQPPTDLKFSRYPLVPALTLDLDEHGAPILDLIGRSRGRAEGLSVGDLERGHVVLSNTWLLISV